MKVFLEWVGTVCATVAMCSLIHMLTRKTGAGKVFRLVSSAVVVCVMLSPLTRLTKNFELPQITVASDIETALYDTAVLQMKTMTEELLLSEVNETLASYGLKAEKLAVSMDISADGNISITDIRLFIPEGNSLHRSWVSQIAEKRLGRAVTVEFTDGG